MSKQNERPGVMLYWKTFDALERMVDGQVKKMLRAIRNYAQRGELPDFTGEPVLDMAWTLLRPELDADAERYEKVRKSRREAANERWGKNAAK